MGRGSKTNSLLPMGTAGKQGVTAVKTPVTLGESASKQILSLATNFNDPLLQGANDVAKVSDAKKTSLARVSTISAADRSKAEEGRRMVLVIDQFRQQYVWYVRASTAYGILFTFLLFVALYLVAVVWQNQIHRIHDANQAWLHPLMPMPPANPITAEKFWGYTKTSLVPQIYHTPVGGALTNTTTEFQALSERQDVLTGLLVTSKRKYVNSHSCAGLPSALCLSEKNLQEESVTLLDGQRVAYDPFFEGYTVYIPGRDAAAELDYYQAQGLLSPNTYAMTVRWVAATPARKVLTVVEFAADISEAGLWSTSLTPLSIPYSLYPHIYAVANRKSEKHHEHLHRRMRRKESERDDDDDDDERSTASGHENHDNGEKKPEEKKPSSTSPRTGERDSIQELDEEESHLPVNPEEDSWVLSSGLDVRGLVELCARILVELLVLVFAVIQIRPVLVQVYKPKDDLVVGTITRELPTDHAGFPYLKSAKALWFCVFPVCFVLWFVLLFYHHMYCVSLVQEFSTLDQSSLEAGEMRLFEQANGSSTSTALYEMPPAAPEESKVRALIKHVITCEFLLSLYHCLNGLVILLLIQMFFEHLAFQKRLAIIIDTFTGIGGDFFHLLVVFLVTLVGFAAIANVMLGSYDQGFNQVLPGSYNLFLSCMGLYKPASTARVDSQSFNKFPLFMEVNEFALNDFATPLFLFYKFLMIMILFKFVIAFIMDAYKQANPAKRAQCKSVLSDLSWFTWFFHQRYLRAKSKGYVELQDLIVALKYCDNVHAERCRQALEAAAADDRAVAGNDDFVRLTNDSQISTSLHSEQHPPHLFLEREEVAWALNEVAQNREAPGELIQMPRGCEIAPTLHHYSSNDVDWIMSNFGEPLSRAVRTNKTDEKRHLTGEARQIFLDFDADDTGVLSLRETALFLQALGHYHVAHDEPLFRKMVKKYDTDEEGLFSQHMLAELLEDQLFEYPEYIHQHLHKGNIVG
ncbi:unnamed protein product [Amoebophrya sp. A120]|nr:unnamed protein product [Amoebophrya sp. A120]|eukprot:GSA120T00004763001.1